MGQPLWKMFFHTALLKNIKNSITSDATILLQKNSKQHLREICTALFITAFTEVRGGRKVNFHQQMNGYKCGMHI